MMKYVYALLLGVGLLAGGALSFGPTEVVAQAKVFPMKSDPTDACVSPEEVTAFQHEMDGVELIMSIYEPEELALFKAALVRLYANAGQTVTEADFPFTHIQFYKDSANALAYHIYAFGPEGADVFGNPCVIADFWDTISNTDALLIDAFGKLPNGVEVVLPPKSFKKVY